MNKTTVTKMKAAMKTVCVSHTTMTMMTKTITTTEINHGWVMETKAKIIIVAMIAEGEIRIAGIVE